MTAKVKVLQSPEQVVIHVISVKEEAAKPGAGAATAEGPAGAAAEPEVVKKGKKEDAAAPAADAKKGDAKKPDADAGKDDGADASGRYLLVMARFNETLLEKPQLEPLPEVPLTTAVMADGVNRDFACFRGSAQCALRIRTAGRYSAAAPARCRPVLRFPASSARSRRA